MLQPRCGWHGYVVVYRGWRYSVWSIQFIIASCSIVQMMLFTCEAIHWIWLYLRAIIRNLSYFLVDDLVSHWLLDERRGCTFHLKDIVMVLHVTHSSLLVNEMAAIDWFAVVKDRIVDVYLSNNAAVRPWRPTFHGVSIVASFNRALAGHQVILELQVRWFVLTKAADTLQVLVQSDVSHADFYFWGIDIALYIQLCTTVPMTIKAINFRTSDRLLKAFSSPMSHLVRALSLALATSDPTSLKRPLHSGATATIRNLQSTTFRSIDIEVVHHATLLILCAESLHPLLAIVIVQSLNTASSQLSD